jgi:hypothetical protein
MADKQGMKISREMADFFSISLPSGVEPTMTMRLIHGAYKSAQLLVAAENGTAPPPFDDVSKVKFPGSPKVSHLLCPQIDLTTLTVLSATTAKNMLIHS